MRARMFFTTICILSLLYSASVLAHITEPGSVLPHIFTGEHLLILLIVGVCIAAVSKVYRRFR